MPKLTYNEKDFLMDGKPYKIMSGAMHYFRIPKEYWRDRLLKLKECGLNTLETYIAWNMHEPEEGVYDFDGNLDVSAYLDICEELGLNVIIRPGPYICAEWEFGGFPWWLLKYENITLRAYDEVYLSKVKRFYTRLFDELRPHLASNGGSIIMLQIENEYGSYGDDKRYMRAIADLYREQKMDCLYFTSDGLEGWMMTGGPLDEHLAVANFGSRPYEQLTRLRGYRPNQPAMCGEYWCGWFDHWFEEHHTRDPKALAADFEEFFKVDGSFSIYMFHGGTNFGFMNGANYQDVYAPTVTSYDYFAPLNEAGDRTEFYYHIRDIIGKYFGKEALPELTAKDSEKYAYGKVKLTNQALLLENLDNLAEPVELAEPKFMEQLDQGYGYVLYRTEMVGSGEELRLDIESVHDRAAIFINGEKKATYERWDMPSDEEKLKVLFPYGEKYSFDILCENMGRVNYGQKLIDRKGVEGVRYNRIRKHFGWQAYRLTMNDLSGLKFTDVKGEVNEPTFLRGYLNIDGTPCDSFIKLDGFTKGFVVINGFNIGRYFNEAGPQKTLYVPAPILKKGKNEIIVFESDKTDSLTVEFLDTPEL